MLRRAFLSAIAGIVILTGCGDSTGPDAGIAGSYSLQSVDGNPMPWRFFVFGNDRIEITGGTATISNAGTYTLTLNFRTMESGQQDTFNDISSGTYVRNGSAITFIDSEDGSEVDGSISGRQLTVVDEDGFVYVFRRN